MHCAHTHVRHSFRVQNAGLRGKPSLQRVQDSPPVCGVSEEVACLPARAGQWFARGSCAKRCAGKTARTTHLLFYGALVRHAVLSVDGRAEDLV
jgi:hypothetical protein